MGALRNFPLNQLLKNGCPPIAIELGSGYGTGIYELLKFQFVNILSVEINPEQVELLNNVFRFDTRVRVINSLTTNFLKSTLGNIHQSIPLFIFSDAHFPNADFGLADFDSEKDENVRMPLIKEMGLIKELRADRGAKDIILIDDISLYDDSDRQYDDDHKKKPNAEKLLPKLHRNYLNKIIENFKETHNSQVITLEQGFLLMTPKMVLNNKI